MQYHRKPPIFEIYHYQGPDLSGVEAWVGTLAADFARDDLAFESVSVVEQSDTDMDGIVHFKVRIQCLYPGGDLWRELIIKDEGLIIWELRESLMFEELPAADLDKYEPISE